MYFFQQHTGYYAVIIQYFAYGILLITGYPYFKILAYLGTFLRVYFIIDTNYHVSGFHDTKLITLNKNCLGCMSLKSTKKPVEKSGGPFLQRKYGFNYF